MMINDMMYIIDMSYMSTIKFIFLMVVVYDDSGDGPACYSMVGCAQQFELHQDTQESCCLGNGAAVRSNSSSECLKCIGEFKG